MRIRYTKPGGKEVDLPDGAASRLIRSGAAEAVKPAGPTEPMASALAAPRPAAAKKPAARSR